MSEKRKACKKCGEVKCFEEFKKHKSYTDNHEGTCKACRLKRRRELYPKVRARYRKLVKAEKGKRRARLQKLSHKEIYRRKCKIKLRAKDKLKYHVNMGNVIKLEQCECCEDGLSHKLIVGHHEDYGYPLNAIWLCSKCHVNYHIGMSEAANNVRSKVGKLYNKKYLSLKEP